MGLSDLSSDGFRRWLHCVQSCKLRLRHQAGCKPQALTKRREATLNPLACQMRNGGLKYQGKLTIRNFEPGFVEHAFD